jgi:hypothetical protein
MKVTFEDRSFDVGWLYIIQMAAAAHGIEDVDVETFPGGKVKIVGRIPGVGVVSSSGADLAESCRNFLDRCAR